MAATGSIERSAVLLTLPFASSGLTAKRSAVASQIERNGGACAPECGRSRVPAVVPAAVCPQRLRRPHRRAVRRGEPGPGGPRYGPGS